LVASWAGGQDTAIKFDQNLSLNHALLAERFPLNFGISAGYANGTVSLANAKAPAKALAEVVGGHFACYANQEPFSPR
jgi:hypothetical protein